MNIYMLDTCICAYIMRERPVSVLSRLTDIVSQGNQVVVSAVTYAEMRYGQVGKKSSPKHRVMIDEFCRRLHQVLPWDAAAVDAATTIKAHLASLGQPIGANDTAIAGHAVAARCILVTHNAREFSRVPGLTWEDWV